MKDRKWWNSVPAWWRSPPPTPPPPPPIPPPENLPELPEGVTPDDVLGVKTRHSLDLTDLPPVREAVPRARSTPPRRRKEGVEGIPDINFSFFNEQTAPVDMEAGTTVVFGEHSTLVVSKKSPNISCINILSVNTRQLSENTYASPSSPSSSISISPNQLDTVPTSSSIVMSSNHPEISTTAHSSISVNLNQSDAMTHRTSSVLISPIPPDTISPRNSLLCSPIQLDSSTLVEASVLTTPNQGATKTPDKTICQTSSILPTFSHQSPPNTSKSHTLPRNSVFMTSNEPLTVCSLPDTPTSPISTAVSTIVDSSPNSPTSLTFSTNGNPPTSIKVESPAATPNSSTITFASTTANPPSYTNSAAEERAKIALPTTPLIVSNLPTSETSIQESPPYTPISPTPTNISITSNLPSNKFTSSGDSPPTTPSSPMISVVSTDVNPPSSGPSPPPENPPPIPTEPIPITSTPVQSIDSPQNTDSVFPAIGSCPTTPTTPTDPVVSAFPDTSPSSPCSLDSPRAGLTISLPLELTSCPDWETITEYSEYYYGKRENGSDYEDIETRQEYCEHRAEDPRRRRATLMRDRRLGRVRTRIRRAWRVVRGWWSDERLRIGDAIQHHAHAQAVKEDDEEKTVVVRRRNGAHQDNSRPSSRAGVRRSRHMPEGQNGFEELRRYIKQGGDFCKDLSSILQERSEAETQYAKSLSKLSGKLLKASKDSVGTVTQAWQRAGAQMEAQSEIHRAFATALSEEVVKPLRQLVEAQHRIRKSVESAVDKTGKSLGEWRTAESKSKKQSFVSARENEKLQDAMLDVRLGRASSTTHLHVTGAGQNHSKDKESAKLESKRRKAEEAVKKADVEYYTFSLRAERARLEWETAVIRGSHCFQALEEERLQQLKDLAACYLHHLQEMGPKMVQGVERLREPVESCDVARDIQTVVSIKGTGQPIPEQLLPDFYAEHITLAMNRDRRRQALVKLLQLIRQDLDRERRGKQGVENLARALQQTPTFGAEDSQQNVTEKLHHMRSMLTYLEAMRYKVQSALAELDGRTRGGHPLAGHIQVTRDRQGLQQSVLKVPPWVREESLDRLAGDSPDWTDRGTADGNSVQPDSDFERVCADEFSSQGSEKDYQSSVLTQCPVISECASESAAPPPDAAPSIGQCRALYEYTANLYDELNLQPGDVIKIHDKQADGWWLGELNGIVGIFPATYVQEID